MRKIPSGFERATGHLEVLRKCMSQDCGKVFRSTSHTVDHACPYCGSNNTKPEAEPTERPHNPKQQNL